MVFEFDHDVVYAEARGILLRCFQRRAFGLSGVWVRGQTDGLGHRDYKLALRKRRAEAVARVFAEASFPLARINAEGMGSTVPAAEKSIRDGRSRDRRVVTVVQVNELTTK